MNRFKPWIFMGFIFLLLCNGLQFFEYHQQNWKWNQEVSRIYQAQVHFPSFQKLTGTPRLNNGIYVILNPACPSESCGTLYQKLSSYLRKQKKSYAILWGSPELLQYGASFNRQHLQSLLNVATLSAQSQTILEQLNANFLKNNQISNSQMLNLEKSQKISEPKAISLFVLEHEWNNMSIFQTSLHSFPVLIRVNHGVESARASLPSDASYSSLIRGIQHLLS